MIGAGHRFDLPAAHRLQPTDACWVDSRNLTPRHPPPLSETHVHVHFCHDAHVATRGEREQRTSTCVSDRVSASKPDLKHVVEVVVDRQLGVINFSPPAGSLERQHQRIGYPRVLVVEGPDFTQQPAATGWV